MKISKKAWIITGVSVIVVAAIVLSVIFLPKITGKKSLLDSNSNSDFMDFLGLNGKKDNDNTKSDKSKQNKKGKDMNSNSASNQENNADHSHIFGESWTYSKSSHWHVCLICGLRDSEADHIYSGDNDKTCDVCGYTRALGTTEIKYPVNSSGYNYTAKIESHSEAEASSLKSKIYAEKNTENIYSISGNKYYIKKTMPLSSIPSNLKSGDAILFERGGTWRVPYQGTITLPKGVTMGAYGSGPKPKFYGSRRNFADNSLWENVPNRKNVRRTLLKSSGNVGNIVFNDVASLGVKKWSLDDLKSNYDFYYSPDEYVYFYYTGDIENDFTSMEMSQRGEIIYFNSGCIVDNICVKYTGSHGIDGAHGTENVKITNCEVGFIGGSMQYDHVRFGNGIEFPIGAKNITVKNNHVYQCYDAGITFQSWSSANVATHYYDIDFSENLIENCCYGIEYFTTSGERGTSAYSDYKNISLHDNVIRFSGYEWSQLQRPDPVMTSHIRGGQWAYVKDCENFTIENNIFDISRASIIFWWWNSSSFAHPAPHNGLTVKNNTYYQAKTPDGRIMTYHNQNPLYASDYTSFVSAVKKFDSAPKKMVWLDNLLLR